MSIARKRIQKATPGPKTGLARLMLQAEAAVLEEGVYTGSLAEWLRESEQALKGAYHIEATPAEHLEAWASSKGLILAMDVDTLTVLGMDPFKPKPRPQVPLVRGLFED